jgi:hypothetical protein
MITRDEILATGLPLDDHGALAEALSVGRTKIVSKEVGDGAISLALGTPAGPLFMLTLEGIANTSIAAEMTPAEIAQIAICRQAWRSINRVGFDVGNQGVRDGIDLMVGSLLTLEQADAIKALAVVDDPVSSQDVSKAMEGY